MGTPLLKKVSRNSEESVPPVGDLHPMGPEAVIVASVGSGRQLDHTDVATHPPSDRYISRRHMTSFLYPSEVYQVQVEAGTALGEAGETKWDPVELQRGGMRLMVSTWRHHGMPALGASDGL